MCSSDLADTEGSTALLNSVLKLSHKDVTGAHALNFKISPSFVKDREGTQAAIRMLKVYLEQMGPQIQINYQNPKDLLDAQVHPDKHRDLVVRIAGYCEYFVNLDHRLQCEIIEDGCRLQVVDNGRGMPEAALNRVTEAFYRVDKSRSRAQGGAGLGLALCEKIAVLHQGRITFESTLGQGTTVTVSLEGGRP